MMQTLFRKWRAIFVVWLKDSLAYRANMFIWILSDTIPVIVMPLVFMAAMPEGGNIRGFSAGGFVFYYLTMLLLTNFITSHMMWDMAHEIREGKFTVYLLRPISHFQASFLQNLTWRMLRLIMFIPLGAVYILLYKNHLHSMQPYLGWEAWSAIILGHFVSFLFIYAMAMIALFLEEVHNIFALYYIPMLFLSGQLFPIDLLPSWAIVLSRVFPFYYTTALPTEIIVGRVSAEVAHGLIALQVAWCVGLALSARVLWRWGLKHYTAVGM